jgi:hypothetical protein
LGGLCGGGRRTILNLSGGRVTSTYGEGKIDLLLGEYENGQPDKAQAEPAKVQLPEPTGRNVFGLTGTVAGGIEYLATAQPQPPQEQRPVDGENLLVGGVGRGS